MPPAKHPPPPPNTPGAPQNPAPPATPGTLGIIGLGLIGGSLALAAKRCGWHVAAYNRAADVAQRAAAAGRIDRAAPAISDLRDCDILFIAVPLAAYNDIFSQVAQIASPSTVITDGGSAKKTTLAAAKQTLGKLHRRFVPAHPIAGKEKSGFAAATADLFHNRLTILCTDDCDPDAAAAAENLWTQAGARISFMSAEAHDKHFAIISHLPHILSYALVSAIAQHGDSEKLLTLAAGGFRDFTRIAGSHPDMWRDICAANRDNLLQAIEWYQRELAAFAADIKQNNSDALWQRMHSAKTLRQLWLNTLEQ